MAVPIATRASWGARRADGEVDLYGLALEVFAHHTVTAQLSENATVEQERAQMRVLEDIGHSRFTRPGVPNAGISYNVLIFPSGRAYQGVSWNRRGTHTDARNSTVRSICFVGNYDVHQPTAAQLATAAAIFAEGKGKWWVASAPLRGHRDIKSTACPGRHVYARLGQIRAGTTPAPKEGFLMELSYEEQKKLLAKVIEAAGGIDRLEQIFAMSTKNESMVSVIRRIDENTRRNDARYAALAAAMDSMAKLVGIDPAELRASIDKAVAESLGRMERDFHETLSDLSITLTTDTPKETDQ